MTTVRLVGRNPPFRGHPPSRSKSARRILPAPRGWRDGIYPLRARLRGNRGAALRRSAAAATLDRPGWRTGVAAPAPLRSALRLHGAVPPAPRGVQRALPLGHPLVVPAGELANRARRSGAKVV